MSDLSYIDEEGHTVFTSLYYKNRGTCCKSNCLHCPFGTTLNNLGLDFKELNDEDIDYAEQIINKSLGLQSDLSGSLLGSAFGNTPKKVVIHKEGKEKFLFIMIKSRICGVAKITTQKRIEEIYLHHRFADQGITKEVVEDFFRST